MNGQDNLVPLGNFQHLFSDDTAGHRLCKVLHHLAAINFCLACTGVIHKLPLALLISYLPQPLVVDVQPVGQLDAVWLNGQQLIAAQGHGHAPHHAAQGFM